MALRIMRVLWVAIGASLGYLAARPFTSNITHLVLITLACGFIGSLFIFVEKRLRRYPIRSLLGGAIGLLFGLLTARLTLDSLPERLIPIPETAPFLSIGLTLILGSLGWVLGFRKGEDWDQRMTPWRRQYASRSKLMLLDTSVIIDGRIADICKTGFLHGMLGIPQFILLELQQIADSSDALKRARGRRGLDVLRTIQEEKDVKVQILNQDYPTSRHVDGKLVELAKDLRAPILTNDFNLNKVAELQGVQVLNINQLANALKPVVLPGELMRVRIVREGKEQGQGVGYLDDGTMIVVENARRFMGKNIDVAVTSVLQTPAGRMIFSVVKEGAEAERPLTQH
jgi:uncharacterized protein YacL